MKNTGQKLILISFILALLAALAVFAYLKPLKNPKAMLKNTTILVAAETIPARTLIDKRMVTTIEVAENEIFKDYIKDSTQIVGKYTRETILKNEGFYKDKLISEGKEELSITIDSDQRAVTINATGDSGVARLIKPGDFVDITTYLPEKTNGVKVIRPDIAKVILQNIKVLAIDEQLTREEQKTDKKSEKASPTFLVTLSVKTTDLEKLVLAENIGNLKLALRPLKDEKTYETNGVVWQDLIQKTSENGGNNKDKENNESNKEDKDNKVEEDNKNDESGIKDESSLQQNSESQDEKYVSYAVKRGDTLKKISELFYGDGNHYELIKQANHIKDEDIIITGEIIKIPILE